MRASRTVIVHTVHIPQGGSQLDAHGHDAARGRPEQKKRAVDRALRSAALRLVSARGLHDITVEDIAKAAGVSKRTFSNHFSCNEDALVGPGRELGEHIADELARRPAQESTLDALHAVLGETVAAAERSPQRLADRAARIQLVRTYRDVLLPRQLAAIADLERAIVAGVTRHTDTDTHAGGDANISGLFPPVAAATGVAMVRVAFNRWRQRGGETPLSLLVDQAFDELANVLVGPLVRPRARRPDRGSASAPRRAKPRLAAARRGPSSAMIRVRRSRSDYAASGMMPPW